MNKKIRIATNDELKKSEVIVGLSFGVRADNSPGLSNETLAKIAENLYKKYELALVLQWEIADCISGIHALKIIREHREKDEYLDTFEVLSQAKEICEFYGWEKIILVAHQDHLPRSIRVAEKLGFKVNVPFIDCPYDKESAQKWTRNKLRFIIHEKIATIIYSREGKI